MAFISLPNGIKIEIIMRKGGAPVVNVVFLQATGVPNLLNLENYTNAVITWWNTNIKPLVTSGTALHTVRATNWNAENGLQYTNDLLTPSAGTRTGGDTPSNVAAVTTFLTGQSGRSFRGRVYNGGMSDDDIVTNTLSTTLVAGYLTAWAAFQADMQALGLEHVVASFYSNLAPRTVGVATPIVSYSMNNVVDTQRRRIPKVLN